MCNDKSNNVTNKHKQMSVCCVCRHTWNVDHYVNFNMCVFFYFSSMHTRDRMIDDRWWWHPPTHHTTNLNRLTYTKKKFLVGHKYFFVFKDILDKQNIFSIWWYISWSSSRMRITQNDDHNDQQDKTIIIERNFFQTLIHL